MRKLTAAVPIAILLLMPSLGFARSETALLTSCAFSKGDAVEKVQQFYGVAYAPQKLASVTPAGAAFQYHFERYGVWVFLDDQLRVSGLRFDRPFRGKIDGVGIGDGAARLRAAKGEPARQFQGLPDMPAMQRREQRVQDILKALPDPVPKSRLMDSLAEAGSVGSAPVQFATAWVYDPGKASFVRYEISPADNKVQSILVTSCLPEA
jgi:hypothetical protein